MTEQEAWLVLNAVSGLGGARISALVAQWGSARGVLVRPQRELARFIPPQVAAQVAGFDRDAFLKEEAALLARHQVHVVTLPEETYPAILKEIPGAPPVLYYKGSIDSAFSPAVAVVGSRKSSLYGTSVAETLSARLAELGITIVSGLAKGIDTAAHRGSLRAGGKTLAVLGCGLAQIYPSENQALAAKIAVSGAVISEFPMQMGPWAHNFPRRNRIISGLSLGVIVVEAALRSGALITSRFALEQGREVFAIPGKVDQWNSQGVNRLIQQGAKLVLGLEDILEEIRPQIADSPARTAMVRNPKGQGDIKGLAPDEKDIYQHISRQAVGIEDLVNQCQGPVNRVLRILSQLELKRHIRQLPGKRFIRNKQ